MQAISTLSFPTPCSIVQSQFTQKPQGSKYHAYEKQVAGIFYSRFCFATCFTIVFNKHMRSRHPYKASFNKISRSINTYRINFNSIFMNPTLHHLQIINAAGYPLSQVTVAILNASNEILGGEITDSSGYVILKLASTAKSVRVSYLGYQQVEFRIEERKFCIE